MLGCVVLAFALCNPNYYGSYGYAQAYSGAYAQQGGYYVQQQPQVVYAQPVQPVYVVQPPPVYVQQPIYGGGYGGAYPFAGSGISVAVGPRGGVRVGVGR